MGNGVRGPDAPTVPVGTLMGIILISGTVMCFAIYALFVSGLSFVGRLIEFFAISIFSAFAFMSSTLPALASVEYLGWNAWFKRLVSTSFMAPTFMFFLYFIFKLIQTDIFVGAISSTDGEAATAKCCSI